MNQSAHSLLIAEDNHSLRSLIARYCTSKGLKVYAVETGDEALTIAQRLFEEENPISMMFADIQMPGTLDGIAAFQKIQNLFPDIYGVVMSGSKDHPAMICPLDHGLHDTLPKPFGVAELKEKIQQLISGDYREIIPQTSSPGNFG